MTNFDFTKLDWVSGLLAGWTYDKPINKWFQGAFRHAHRLTRPCPTCSEIIVLDVTTKALEGKATNHGLALRRCKKCRTALKAGPEVYAMRKAEVADKPAPAAAAPPPVVQVATAPADNGELELLRTANITMKEELDGLYVLNKELRERLALYEEPNASVATPAQPAKPAIPKTYKLPPEPLTMTESTKRMTAALKNNAKMPWEET